MDPFTDYGCPGIAKGCSKVYIIGLVEVDVGSVVVVEGGGDHGEVMLQVSLVYRQVQTQHTLPLSLWKDGLCFVRS